MLRGKWEGLDAVVKIQEESVNCRVLPGDDVRRMKVCCRTAFLFHFASSDPCSSRFWLAVSMLMNVLFHFSVLILYMLKYFADDTFYYSQIDRIPMER